MNIELGPTLVTPGLALLAGILILVAPRVLNYFLTVYLTVVGLEPPVRFEAAVVAGRHSCLTGNL